MKVVHERIPLRAGDEQLAVRVEHRAPRVGLRAARRPANLLGDVELETLGRDAVVRLVTRGFAFSRGSTMIRSMKSSTTTAMA